MPLFSSVRWAESKIWRHCLSFWVFRGRKENLYSPRETTRIETLEHKWNRVLGLLLEAKSSYSETGNIVWEPQLWIQWKDAFFGGVVYFCRQGVQCEVQSHTGIEFGMEALPGEKNYWKKVVGFNWAGQGQRRYSFYSWMKGQVWKTLGLCLGGILLVVRVPVNQLGLRFQLGNRSGKLGCSWLEGGF